MKVKVLKSFIDGDKKAIHPIGKIITISQDRYKEISAIEGDPLVEEVETTSGGNPEEVDK